MEKLDTKFTHCICPNIKLIGILGIELHTDSLKTAGETDISENKRKQKDKKTINKPK